MLRSFFRVQSCVLLAMLSVWTATSQADLSSPKTAQVHASAGVRDGEHFPGLTDLCDLSRRLIVAGKREGDPAQPRPERPAREAQAPLPPMQVFDNLFFVGNRQVSAWLLGTPDGYVLIDAMNNDQQAETIISAGIVRLGLNPEQIKYVVVTHAHGDHYGGQNYITSTYGARVAMSDADWSLLEDPTQRIDNPRWGPRPARDIVVKDGEVLTVADTAVHIQETPGHTPGTISLIFQVFDKGVPHTAALWGGTGFNFGPDGRKFRQYAASAARFGDIAAQQGVNVFLSNHPNRDGSIDKMAQLPTRGASDPHPFVMGPPALKAFSVLQQCALAQAVRVETGAK